MSRLSISRTQVLVSLGVLAFIVVMAFMIAPNPAPPDDDGDKFTGRWLVNGIDAQDIEYSGTLVITAIRGGYELQWLITGGINEGTGDVAGDVLRGEWRTTEGIGPRRTGTVEYVLVGDMLAGTTTVDGVAGFGTEEGFPPDQ